jgi:hypothetical protein
MKRVVLAFTLLALGIAGSTRMADAGMSEAAVGRVVRFLGSFRGTPVPPEWDGIWTTIDSTYFNCEISFAPPTPGADTICAGATFEQPSDPGFNVTCSGTSDATTFSMQCAGTADLGGGCTGTVAFTIDGTRTGGTFKRVSVMNFTPTTPTAECIAACIRTVSYGTRTGPAPTEYCATTEAKPSSWGGLKIMYR